MITLHHFSDVWGFDPNPFCLKTESYMRLARIRFEKIASPGSMFRASEKKLPYIIDDGEVVAGSDTIIMHLRQKYNFWLDTWLNREQSGIAHAVSRMLEDGTYWVLTYSRWMEPNTYAKYRHVVLKKIPLPFRYTAAQIVRRAHKRACYHQGISRYSPAEIYQIGARDIQAVASALGGNLYFFGDRPASVDTVIYGFLGNVYFAPLETEPKKSVGRHSNLIAYLNRMRNLIMGEKPDLSQ